MMKFSDLLRDFGFLLKEFGDFFNESVVFMKDWRLGIMDCTVVEPVETTFFRIQTLGVRI